MVELGVLVNEGDVAVVVGGGAGDALQMAFHGALQDGHAVVLGQVDYTQHTSHDTELVHVVDSWGLGVVALCHYDYGHILLFGHTGKLKRALACQCDGHDHAGEEDGVAQWEQRDFVSHRVFME